MYELEGWISQNAGEHIIVYRPESLQKSTKAVHSLALHVVASLRRAALDISEQPQLHLVRILYIYIYTYIYHGKRTSVAAMETCA